MGSKGWPSELSGERLVAAVRAHLHAPAARAIARHLSHSPAMLDELVSLGRYLGIEAAQFPELMWLVDVASIPELPIGWLRCELTLTLTLTKTRSRTRTQTRTLTRTRCEDIDGRVYYWNAALSLAQWEHPQHSYIVGVATRLTQSVSRARRTSGAAAQEAEVRAQAAVEGDESFRSRRSSFIEE